MRGAALVAVDVEGGVDVWGIDGAGVCDLIDDDPSLLGIPGALETSGCVSSEDAADCANFASLLFLIYHSVSIIL